MIDSGGKKEVLSFAEYRTRFEEYKRAGRQQGMTPYLRTWYFEDDLPGLMDDWSTPPHFGDDAFRRLPKELQPPFQWLFFGPAGTESRLHVDVWETDAWLCMLEGTKRFTLYHPGHRKYIEARHPPSAPHPAQSPSASGVWSAQNTGGYLGTCAQWVWRVR